MAWNRCCRPFSIHHFVRTYTHNLKTKGRIRMLYLTNDCSTIGEIYFLGYNCMRDTIGKLWIQTRIATSFQYDILCIFILVTWKLQVVYGPSTSWMTALLSEMPIFCIRAGYAIWLASYGSKHVSQCLSGKQFVRMYTHITWKVQVIYWTFAYRTTALQSETFLVCFRVAWEIQLESFGPRYASVVLWYNIVCVHVYCKSLHLSLIGAQLRMTT